jgi:hypothetical protein
LAARRPDAEWVSERALLRERRGKGRAHLPDALVCAEGQEVPVEVELTLKKRERLEAIVSGHLAAYPAVWYFAAPGPRRMLEQIARRHGPERVQVLDLPGATFFLENHNARNGVRP